MKVVVVVGGVGGARFLLGVKAALGLPPIGAGESAHEITALVNTGDDVWMHGLRIAPDLDTCMYTLGGGIDPERGWGHQGETWAVKEELAAYGAEPTWFGLGDKDVATHLIRTRMLRAGYPLSAVTEALCDRWKPGVRLLPMTDERVETHVVVDDPDAQSEAASAAHHDGGQAPSESHAQPSDAGSTSASASASTQPQRKALHFQEWWVRYRAGLHAHSIVPVGAEEAKPAPGVLESIADADAVLFAPSNPVVSVGTVLSVPGVREALRKTAAGVVGVSPIINGKPLRGMADACLTAIGVETSAEAVGRHYGSRQTSADGLLDGWLVAEGETVHVPGVAVRAVPLLMSDVDATAAMAKAALELSGVDVE